MRARLLCCTVLIAAHAADARAQAVAASPLPIVDVPFVSQSELLCGGAAAAMVLRYWGEREIASEAFAHLVDRSAAGIRTDALIAELRRRGWFARDAAGDEGLARAELARNRPVLMLIEDRPSVFHYVVTVAWHERGVIFHDPARGPFRVMSTGEFVRRWRAARSWMAVVLPAQPAPWIGDPGSGIRELDVRTSEPEARSPDRGSTCQQAVADGVRLAQSKDLAAAEQTLVFALQCPGATRELAGIRVLQKRWAEAADLSAAAAAADPSDTYAWKVLATSRFVQDDRLGALDAWNHAGEPRVDLVRIDGLTRTRHPVVERLIGVRPGELLTKGRFARARRRLAELPSAASVRLEYVPAPSGLAELRGAVAERPLVPRGTAALASAALVAAANREVRLTTGALIGGGEQVSGGWRFWPDRQRVDASMRAPGPWGVWRLDAFSERQPFTDARFPAAERVGARVAVTDWATAFLRWTVTAGVDEWAGERPRGAVGGNVAWTWRGDRITGDAGMQTWPGRTAFGTAAATLRARSAVDVGPNRTIGEGVMVETTVTAQLATARSPLDLWGAGDTGHARAPLLRAHPLLDGGRFRVDRLGRAVMNGSVEARRWWRVRGPIRGAAAAFTDVGRTDRRWTGGPVVDVDAGIGGRLAIDGISGMFRVDVARGLRDGATALSVGYQP